ncbi:MAG: Transporter [Verrucomicrobiaceae bacterium]|nr:Transporter [Verrucomicrobiaceae bacterium]
MPERPLTHYALLSIGAAVVTFFLKLVAWRLTGSVGLLSDALESLANVAAALVAFASISVAMKPEDDDHAHGHSKAEYFAAGVEGALIMVAALVIGWEAVDRFFTPQAISQPVLGLTVSMGASLINFLVARVLARVALKRRSIALEADAKHLMADVWTSIAVLVAVSLVALTGWAVLDPLIGLLLAVHIIVIGVKLIGESMHGLMDSAVSPQELEAIRNALDQYSEEGVQYHALRTRRAGSLKFMSVHLLMPGDWSIARGHDLSEQIETDLRALIPGLVVVTHLEPVEDPVSWHDVGLERTAEP